MNECLSERSSKMPIVTKRFGILKDIINNEYQIEDIYKHALMKKMSNGIFTSRNINSNSNTLKSHISFPSSRRENSSCNSTSIIPKNIGIKNSNIASLLYKSIKLNS